MADEFARIARIRALLQSDAAQHDAGVTVGIGDDAAVLAARGGALVLSVDACVEHVHFERSFAGLDTLAERAFTAAISDLAAMGALPRAALSALVLPSNVTDSDLDELVSGLARGAERYACPIIGGNLSRGGELSLTTTVLGDGGSAVITRAGARAGDGVYVTGPLGSAAMGLLLLQAGDAAPHATAFIEAWRRPHARIAQGLALRGAATGAIEISDGALQDLRHLCVASNVGADLDAASVPMYPTLAATAERYARNPLELALCGGEDYELLYTLPAGTADPANGTRIGVFTEHAGEVILRDGAGAALPLPAGGHLHFR